MLATFVNGRLLHLLKISQAFKTDFVKVKLSNRLRSLRPVATFSTLSMTSNFGCFASSRGPVQTNLYSFYSTSGFSNWYATQFQKGEVYDALYVTFTDLVSDRVQNLCFLKCGVVTFRFKWQSHTILT